MWQANFSSLSRSDEVAYLMEPLGSVWGSPLISCWPLQFLSCRYVPRWSSVAKDRVKSLNKERTSASRSCTVAQFPASGGSHKCMPGILGPSPLPSTPRRPPLGFLRYISYRVYQNSKMPLTKGQLCTHSTDKAHSPPSTTISWKSHFFSTQLHCWGAWQGPRCHRGCRWVGIDSPSFLRRLQALLTPKGSLGMLPSYFV